MKKGHNKKAVVSLTTPYEAMKDEEKNHFWSRYDSSFLFTTFKRLKSMLFTFARNIFANLVQQTTSRIQRVQKIKSRNAVLQESEGKRYLFIIFHQHYHDLLSKISSISFVDGYHISFFYLFINVSILVLFPTICILCHVLWRVSKTVLLKHQMFGMPHKQLPCPSLFHL